MVYIIVHLNIKIGRQMDPNGPPSWPGRVGTVGTVSACTFAEAAVMDSLRKIFHDGDTDGSGELDMDELHALICKHQAAQWDWPKGLTQPDVN